MEKKTSGNCLIEYSNNIQRIFNRKKKLTCSQIKKITPRLGIEYVYQFNPLNNHFKKVYSKEEILLKQNVIVIYFVLSNIGLLVSLNQFISDENIFPETMLESIYQIKYYCTISKRVLDGSKIIVTALPIESFQLPKDNDYVNILETFIE